MKPVILSINLLSAGLFQAHNKIPPQAVVRPQGRTTTENPAWANPSPSPVASGEGRGPLPLREAWLSWWPTTLPSLSTCSQTQHGKVADAEEGGGGFRGFPTWHSECHVLT